MPSRAFALLLLLPLVSCEADAAGSPCRRGKYHPGERWTKLAGQVRMACIGDSRMRDGVDPRLFYGAHNRKFPVVWKSANTGSVQAYDGMLRDYLG